MKRSYVVAMEVAAFAVFGVLIDAILFVEHSFIADAIRFWLK